MYNFLIGKIYIFTIFAYELFKVKMEKMLIIPEIHNFYGHNISKYCSQIIVVHVHANGFL